MTTSTAPLSILGVGLWLRGFPSTAAWRFGTPDPAATKPLGLALDRVNRRRASQLGRALADVGAEAMSEAEVDPATVPTVIGSSIGETSTMIILLDQMWRQRVPMSPAGFTMSVHNAASGLISITNGNRGFSTSVAADDDTPAGALLEAVGLVHAFGGPVVVACGDEPPPADLVPAEMEYELLAAAVVVAPADQPGPVLARLRLTLGGQATVAPASVPESLTRNPQVGLLDLVVAVKSGRSGRVRLNRWSDASWCAEIGTPEDE